MRKIHSVSIVILLCLFKTTTANMGIGARRSIYHPIKDDGSVKNGQSIRNDQSIQDDRFIQKGPSIQNGRSIQYSNLIQDDHLIQNDRSMQRGRTIQKVRSIHEDRSSSMYLRDVSMLSDSRTIGSRWYKKVINIHDQDGRKDTKRGQLMCHELCALTCRVLCWQKQRVG